MAQLFFLTWPVPVLRLAEENSLKLLGWALPSPRDAPSRQVCGIMLLPLLWMVEVIRAFAPVQAQGAGSARPERQVSTNTSWPPLGWCGIVLA